MLGTSHRSQRTPDPAAGESSAPAPRAHLAPGTMGGGDNTEWADTANITHRSNNCKKQASSEKSTLETVTMRHKRSQLTTLMIPVSIRFVGAFMACVSLN